MTVSLFELLAAVLELLPQAAASVRAFCKSCAVTQWKSTAWVAVAAKSIIPVNRAKVKERSIGFISVISSRLDSDAAVYWDFGRS